MKKISDFRFPISDLGKSHASRDKTSIANHQSRIANSSGAALVIVLSFIVLLMVVLMAYFSQSLLDRQMSKSSSNIALVDNFADGAANTVIGDLRQEITDPNRSTVTNIVTGSVTSKLYHPNTPSNVVPALAGSTGASGLENLVKRSSSSNAFYPGGPTKAAASSTTNASANGRYISAVRWNKPIFIQPTSTTDLTPVSSAGFVPPDWIYVARDGSNPTNWDTNMRWSETAPTTVVGRYAYAIYDEGGLLDANVAGYPDSLGNATASPVPYKSALAFADLSKIGLTANQIDALVGWRNYASAQASGDFASYTFPDSGAIYGRSVLSNTNGFLKTSNTGVQNGRTDRMFASRQELLNFLQNGVGLPATNQAFQCLTTFSRCSSRPSYRPDPNRPKVLGNAYSGTGNFGVVGNSAYLRDDNYNPAFLTIRAKSAFDRNDTDASGNAIKAVVGEPLVKKRFALNRLGWLTYKGPSADRTRYQAGDASPGATSADYDMWALVNLHGISPSLLEQGTAANIKKYFGLTWTASPAGAGNPGGYWTYSPGTANIIMKLEDVAGLTGSDAREPDFFELLQSSICAGSLAKTTVGRDWKNNSGKKSLIAQLKENTNIYNHIIQIGANIIDQFDLDDFPTNIVFDDGVQPRYFSGIEDLPYFYRAMELAVPTQLPVPNSTDPTQTVSPPVDWTAPGNTPGEVVDLCVPGVWNPHALRTSGATATALRPLNLRACISVFSTADPGEPFIAYTPLIGVGTYSRTSSPQTIIPPPTQQWITYTESVLYAPWGVGSYDPNRGCLIMPATGSPENTAITFNNDPALYRQTTFLMQPNIPAGSGIALDSNNVIASGNATWASGVPDINEPAKQYIGFYGGKAGLRWNNTANVTCTVQSLRQNPAHYPTISLEYYSAGKWIPYQQVMCLSSGMAWVNLGGLTHNIPVSQKIVGAKAGGDTRWDPRGRRWLTMGNVFGAGVSWIDSNKTIEESFLPGAQLEPWGDVSGNGGCAYAHMAANMLLYHDFDIPNYSSPSWGLVNTAGYMLDADGVVRPGMAAYTGTDSSVGWPMATIYGNASNPSTVSDPTNVQNRPVILNRPFRSVAELGYTYSDTPWRNLDFSTPQSGNAALLDVFCIQEDKTAEGMTAGKVDLNTRQVPVLQAILAGAYRDDVLQPANSDTPLSPADAENIAKALVARTTDTALGKGPLSNVADLVGRYVAGYANSSFPNAYSTSLYSTPTSIPFAGFIDDLTSGLYPTGGLASSRVQRLRESSIRALSAAGMAGTWNLMIDLIAQTGKYPASATHLDQFVVEGEKRVWLHVAIDRQTGEIIDQQIEQVIE